MRRWRWRGCDGDGVDGGGGAACAPRQCPSGAPLFALLDPTPLGLPTRTRAIRKTRFAFSAFRATEITGARKKEVPKNGSVQYIIVNCGPKTVPFFVPLFGNHFSFVLTFFQLFFLSPRRWRFRFAASRRPCLQRRRGGGRRRQQRKWRQRRERRRRWLRRQRHQRLQRWQRQRRRQRQRLWHWRQQQHQWQ